MRLDDFIEFMINDLEGGAKKHRNAGETHDTAYGVYGKFYKLPVSMEEAIKFYKTEFYQELTGVEDVDLFILQFSVNVGKAKVTQLVKDWQQANELEPLDLPTIATLQRSSYRSLPSRFQVFQKGWENRIIKTLAWLDK